jgi:hypothetical protein
MNRQPRYEKHTQDDHFVRRIDHETGLIDSICLHCFATVCSASDTAINARSEAAHACVPKQRAAANRAQ